MIENKADVMLTNYENKTCKEVAEDMGHGPLVDTLDYHISRERMWRNRNCLLKIALKKEHTSEVTFKKISLDIFRDIIKYA